MSRSDDGTDAPAGDEPFLVAASLSGAADAEWARNAAEHVSVALLGGVALDPASRAAARDLVARGREEFLPADPLAFVAEQLDAVAAADAPVRAGINVRSATPEPVREAAEICADRDAVCEVNAHCRQPELRAVGCGESLLGDPDRLARYVAAAVETGATTSVKVRAEVPGIDLVAAAETVAGAGADWIHVDAMDSEAVVGGVAAAIDEADKEDELADLTLVANNGVRGRETVAEYAARGADAVSVGRPTEEPPVLARVADAVSDWRTGALRDRDGGAEPEAEAQP
ncbi:dihydropyrimidine dehydrogenase [Halorubrum sp. BOL3-1]|uniref:tRNA-dihydrouridine synthase n=1 Tax=Halorubrum sp. BOL3-1 TaxID=2497325 RepID=UPI00100523FB|nr:tRNA-dihydrouridine synthase [Halorubrum sp. BOL3-1]QAU13619.1 dihydropyrimidine dehydrogenase [Halorubrum sp. BOL3-1]